MTSTYYCLFDEVALGRKAGKKGEMLISSLTPLLVVLVDGLSLSISLQSIHYFFFSFGLDRPLGPLWITPCY